MKRALALLLFLALASPAPAHFVWVAPQPDGTTALLVFSDSLEPDANVAITKIKQTTVTGHSLSGAHGVPLTKKDGKDCYTLTGPGKGPFIVHAQCRYGVLTKGTDDPFLLMYHAKGVVGMAADQRSAHSVLTPLAAGKTEFDVVLSKHGPTLLFRGKPAPKAEVVQLVPGQEDSVKGATDEHGVFRFQEHKSAGVLALRFKVVEDKEGELDGKAYKQVRHYFTFTVPVQAPGKAGKEGAGKGTKDLKADPAATKLLSDARAARAVWNKFPGFSADLEINRDGQVTKTKVQVSAEGKVNLDKVKDLEPMVYQQTKREISSLVGHRLPGGPYDTPCAFADSQEHHPQGRLIHILNDELHSSYRIRDRQILEVNRVTGDTRFTISVLDNAWTKEKQYLPTAYVVNTWEVKGGALKSSRTHFHTWTRLGDYDLPESVRVVNASAGPLEAMTLRFSNIQLGEK